jgi:hypothetical protein
LALVSLARAAGADTALDPEERDFLRVINEYRAGFGLPCLSPSPTLAAAADWFSQDMGELGFFDHREPPCDENGSHCTGRDPFERMAAFGHTGWTTAGENIAAGYDTADAVFEGWRNSPGHDANMRGEGFTAIGIGRVEVPGSAYRIYWTTDFSNLVDGDEDCNDPGPGGSGGSGGTGGSGGSGGSGGHGGTGGAGGAGGDSGSGGSGGAGGEPDRSGGGDGGGCASGAGGAAPGSIALALLALLTRRRP